jgi:hypothetical protein
MPADQKPRAYSLTGQFVELCDCYTICPCWIDRPPDEGRCTGAFGWTISTGRIGRVKVDGLAVVSVSFHTGHRATGGQEVSLFVDDRASDAQFEALAAVFSGVAGGPLSELRKVMGVLRETERAPISLLLEGDHISLTIDRRVSGDARVVKSPDGKTTELHNGRLSTILGPTAEVGVSTDFRVDLGGFGFSIEVKGRAAMRGPFAYHSTGEPA